MAALAMDDVRQAGNARRTARKELLDELRYAGSKREAQDLCAELLLAEEPALEGLSVFDLVRQCRGVGKERAREILVSAEIADPTVTIGAIRARDALRLGKVLRGEAVA